MSFVALDSVSFADCSVGSISPQDVPAPRTRQPGAAALRPSSPGGPQPSIPRHRPVAPEDEALRTLDHSMDELYGALHHRGPRGSRSVSRSDRSSAGSHIQDLCAKIDVLAQVVLRHEHELRERSAPASPEATSALMESILHKVEAVNHLIAGSSQRREAHRGSVGRLVDAVSSATRDAAEFSDSGRMVSPAAPLGFHAHALGNATHDEVHPVDCSRVSSCAARLEMSGTRSSAASSRIAPDERSPPRARHYAVPACPDFDEEAEIEAEVEAEAEATPEEPSPRRVRGFTTTARAVAAVSVPRTATKQPEFLLQSASKPVKPHADYLSRQLFNTSTSSAGSASTTASTSAPHDTVSDLVAENESLKAQLRQQLQRNDRLVQAMDELGATPAGRHRPMLF